MQGLYNFYTKVDLCRSNFEYEFLTLFAVYNQGQNDAGDQSNMNLSQKCLLVQCGFEPKSYFRDGFYRLYQSIIYFHFRCCYACSTLLCLPI